jgi:hypothetical protein
MGVIFCGCFTAGPCDISATSRAQAVLRQKRMNETRPNMNTHGLAETRIEFQKVSHEATIFASLHTSCLSGEIFILAVAKITYSLQFEE